MTSPTSLPVRYHAADGSPRLSVTQALSFARQIDTTWFTPEAAERGQLVHTMTERYDRGESLVMPDDLRGYIEAYATFLGVVRPEYEATEIEVQSDVLCLNGRLDRLCRRLFGERAILDFKTGPPYPWHGLQLAAYNMLRGEFVPRWTVHLRSDGSYRMKEHTDVADYRRFEYALAESQGRIYSDGSYWLELPSA